MVGLERLLIGRSLAGRYAVQELIGPGRAGLVYRAHDAERDADVAVKVLNAPRAPEARERFRQLVAREVAAASAIQHPHVAALYAMGGDAELELDFIVSELMRGQSLAGVLSQRGKPPISLGLRLLGDAAEGLAAGHAAGLVHRDLRPASLYLVRSEAERHVRVKITGFGVPQLVRRESLAVAAPEIRAYASPEMLAGGSARLTPASDVFSLGMIGFELMTGALALDDAARAAMADGRAVEIEPPAEVAASVPPHVMDAVLQALRMNPAERFADGAAFAAAVREPAAPRAVSVPRIVTAPVESAPTAEPQPVTAAAPEEPAPTVDAAAIIALATSAAGDAEPVAERAPAAEPPAAEETVMATTSAEDVPAAVEETVMEMPPAAESPVVAAEAVAAAAQAEDIAPAAEQPSATVVEEIPAPSHPHSAPPKRQVGDLELYYPPAKAKQSEPEIPLVVTPIAASAAAPEPAAAAPVEEPPVEIVAPDAAAAAIPVVAEAVAPAPPPVVDEAPAADVDAAATAAAVAAAPAPRALKLIAGGGNKTFRAPPAMAAGFVLGILVLGSVAWIATRHKPEEAGAATPAAAALAANATAGAPTPNAAAPAATQPEAATPAAADTVAKTPAQQAALDAAKKKAEEDRRRQDEEKARQAALLLQQQQQAAAAAQQPQQPVVQAPVQQPQARPQQVAVAPPPAPPPVPPPAPAPAREEAAPARPSNEVYDIDVVEERPRLTNAAELQRALNDRYPPQLASNRVSGRVTATFVVGTDGRVDPSSIRILNSPNQGFNAPTQGVLRRARFRPATVKGQAVRVQVTMPVTWSLDGQ